MPPRTRTKAPEPEAKDYSDYIEKAATPTQERMIEWLQGDDVGYDPASAKTKAEAFAMGAKLVFALRMEFQRSPFNQGALEERRAELEEAKAETKAAAPKKTRTTRAAKAKAAEVEPEPEDDEIFEDEEDDIVEEEEVEEETPAPAPAKRTRAKAAAAPAAPAPKRATRTTRASRAKTSGAAPF